MATLQKVQRTENHLQSGGAEQYGNFLKSMENAVEVLLELRSPCVQALLLVAFSPGDSYKECAKFRSRPARGCGAITSP
jgi:hypothetical protein